MISNYCNSDFIAFGFFFGRESCNLQAKARPLRPKVESIAAENFLARKLNWEERSTSRQESRFPSFSVDLVGSSIVLALLLSPGFRCKSGIQSGAKNKTEKMFDDRRQVRCGASERGNPLESSSIPTLAAPKSSTH